MAAVISRLLNFFGFGEQRQPDLKERIERAIVQLEIIEDRVAELRYRFERRSRELFERVIMLIKRGERSRAAIYAGEVSQIRSILKMVMTIQNLIIATKERLKTVKDVRELGQVLMVFGAALESVRSEVETIHPNLMMVFDEISRRVKNMIVETSIDANVNVDPAIVTSSAIEVLEEAKKAAEEAIRESFPEPPVDSVIQLEPKKSSDEKSRVPIAVGYSGGRKDLEELVLAYIREHGGYLDLRDFTRRYGVERSEVLRTLYKLAEKGLIKLS